MGNLERRVKALEALTSPPEPWREVVIPRSMERYWHAMDSARRVQCGFEPLPDLEYTEEDRQDDLDALEHMIPAMRAEPGWQTEEAKEFLDQWERVTRERLGDRKLHD